MSTGKWSSCLPAATSCDAAMIALASFSSSLPSSQLASAQAAFKWPKAWITAGRHRLVRDGKILDGPGRRRAVQRVGRHLHLAHRVAFGAEAWSWQYVAESQLARDKIAAMILTTAAERNGESPRFPATAFVRLLSTIAFLQPMR